MCCEVVSRLVDLGVTSSGSGTPLGVTGSGSGTPLGVTGSGSGTPLSVQAKSRNGWRLS